MFVLNIDDGMNNKSKIKIKDKRNDRISNIILVLGMIIGIVIMGVGTYIAIINIPIVGFKSPISSLLPTLKTIYINQSLYPLHFQTQTSFNYIFYSNTSDCINRATYQITTINYTTQKLNITKYIITNMSRLKFVLYNTNLMSSSNTLIYLSNNYTLVCPK